MFEFARFYPSLFDISSRVPLSYDLRVQGRSVIGVMFDTPRAQGKPQPSRFFILMTVSGDEGVGDH